MANENKPFGLKPINEPGSGMRRTPYLIQSGDTRFFGINQPIGLSYYVNDDPDEIGLYGSSVPGYYLSAGISLYLIGSIVELFDPQGKPRKFHPPDNEDEGEWTAIVTDHPYQRYLIQENDEGPIIKSKTMIMAIIDWWTGDRINQKTGLSKDVVHGLSSTNSLYSFSIGGVTTHNLLLIEPWKMSGNKWGEKYCVWVCEILSHVLTRGK